MEYRKSFSASADQRLRTCAIASVFFFCEINIADCKHASEIFNGLQGSQGPQGRVAYQDCQTVYKHRAIKLVAV